MHFLKGVNEPNSVYLFNWEEKTWTTGPDSLYPHAKHGCAKVKGKQKFHLGPYQNYMEVVSKGVSHLATKHCRAKLFTIAVFI